MSEIYELTEKELSDINNLLISKTNISDTSLCFCGSNNDFSHCCKATPNSWITTTKFTEELVAFNKSRGWVNVDNQDIIFLFPKFQECYLGLFDMCANPGCNGKPTINSHVYGKKHLEKYLSSKQCKTHNTYSNIQDYFMMVDTGKPITYRTFCDKCEQLFKEVDNPDHDVLDEQNSFLHLLRTLSYQYQFTRLDLAFAHQFILCIKGVIETERKMDTGEANTVIDLDWFLASNIRHQYQTKLRDKLWGLSRNNLSGIKIPHIHTRCISSTNVLFASGIYNPSHDLNGDEIISDESASFFYYVIPKGDKAVCVTVASFDEEYKEMIEQLASLNNYAFIKYINHLVSSCSLPLSLILQDTHKINSNMIDKIEKKRALTAEFNPKRPSDLASRKIFARFIV